MVAKAVRGLRYASFPAFITQPTAGRQCAPEPTTLPHSPLSTHLGESQCQFVLGVRVVSFSQSSPLTPALSRRERGYWLQPFGERLPTLLSQMETCRYWRYTVFIENFNPFFGSPCSLPCISSKTRQKRHTANCNGFAADFNTPESAALFLDVKVSIR